MTMQERVENVRRRLEACEKLRDLMDVALEDAHQALRELEIDMHQVATLVDVPASASDAPHAGARQ